MQYILRSRRNNFGNEEVLVIDIFAAAENGYFADLGAIFETERGDIERHDDGDVFGEARNDDIACSLTETTALANADGFTRERKGNANADFAVGIDNIEVSVNDAARKRIALDGFDHHIEALVINGEVEDNIGAIIGRKSFNKIIGLHGSTDGINPAAIAGNGNGAGGAKFAGGTFFAGNTGYALDFNFVHFG